MIDYLQPRVFFYEMTHNETENELLDLRQRIEEMLVVGDVITYDCYSGSGHTVVFILEKFSSDLLNMVKQ